MECTAHGSARREDFPSLLCSKPSFHTAIMQQPAISSFQTHATLMHSETRLGLFPLSSSSQARPAICPQVSWERAAGVPGWDWAACVISPLLFSWPLFQMCLAILRSTAGGLSDPLALLIQHNPVHMGHPSSRCSHWVPHEQCSFSTEAQNITRSF